MSKYVKEGILGNYKEVAGGYSDPECTHVIMTLKEYDKSWERKAQLFEKRSVLRAGQIVRFVLRTKEPIIK